ncbi:MAG: hypothetical protein PUB98_05755 [Clostridiales bacterium]|nr:hypothetical protein [Clostridiales bacterium]
MNRNEELKMTHSGIYKSDGKRCVSVRFERGKDVAEGRLPWGKIERSEGFTAEEIAGLESYLEQKCDEIFENAKPLNDIRRLL